MQNIFNIKDLLLFLIRCNSATTSSKNIARAFAVFDLSYFVTNINAYFGFKLLYQKICRKKSVTDFLVHFIKASKNIVRINFLRRIFLLLLTKAKFSFMKNDVNALWPLSAAGS
jgi:hypothetical protein